MKSITLISLFIVFSLFNNTILHAKTNAQIYIKKDSIAVPLLISPISYAACDSTCSFSWTSSGKKITYELLIADNNNFNNSKNIVTKDTTIVCNLGNKSNYYKYCKVRAWKNNKNYSAWSLVVIIIHADNSLIIQPEKLYQGGCHGNCGNCNHPCGRRFPK